MTVLFYLIFLVSIFFVPEKIWKKFYKIKVSRKDGAQDLYRELSYKRGSALSEYKYFTGVFTKLFRLEREFGIDISKAIRSLKKGLLLDREFEKKRKKKSLQAILQLISMSAVIWLFTLATISIVGIQIHTKNLLIIAAWQSIGLSLYVFFSRKIYSKFFCSLEFIFEHLYVFQTLSLSELSVGEILRESNMEMLYRSQWFLSYQSLLEETLENWQFRGVSPQENIRFLINEVELYRNELFSNFLTIQNILSFLTSSIFILGSYFYYLSHLIDAFLIE